MPQSGRESEAPDGSYVGTVHRPYETPVNLSNYIAAIDKRFCSGIATEHSYRGDLHELLTALCPGVEVTTQPERIACGAPDYILTRHANPVGYVEAKVPGEDLDGAQLKEQLDRYRASLDNLVITDHLLFRFYRAGELITAIRIAEVVGDQIRPTPSAFSEFRTLLGDFAAWQAERITSPQKLSTLMAANARLLASIIERAVSSDESTEANTPLRQQMAAFRKLLIHDLDAKTFADLVAQTIAYGMFAARLRHNSPKGFSRLEAAQLLPRSNPFLRKLFCDLGGLDLDQRIVWVVDALAHIYRATDIDSIIAAFDRRSGRSDAFMHFYEDFLSDYNPKLRKSRGVWYTPDSVVRFIVRAVDEVLSRDFGLARGLADTSTVPITVDSQVRDNRTKSGYQQLRKQVHRVQLLDPATGTGTFLAGVVEHIYSQFEGEQDHWPQYVEEDLLPRLNGFEILMPSYAMAHLNLDLVLRGTGFDIDAPTPNASRPQQRLRVFLTNSLEEAHPDTGTLFASWLSQEAIEADAVKREGSVMVVLGNPPYSAISSNTGKWITELIEDYKYVDAKHFGERKHWLHDDYVKFIRFGEHFIEKNGEGVLAYITNHSFLDNPTFRGMRWHLLNTFESLYVLDLHGSSQKPENAPSGCKDENVFDIQQGVSINLFVRTKKKRKGQLGRVFHADLWGLREEKYATLDAASLDTIDFKQLDYSEPFYFFVPRDESNRAAYVKGFKINEMFQKSGTGVFTVRDRLVVAFDKNELLSRLRAFSNPDLNDAEARLQYFGEGTKGKYLKGDTRGWKMPAARQALRTLDLEANVHAYHYRPFDTRQLFYHPSMVDWGREKLMKATFAQENLALIICRQSAIDRWEHCNVTDRLVDGCYVSNRTKERGCLFPLYVYKGEATQGAASNGSVGQNLDTKLAEQLVAGLGFTFQFDENRLFEHGEGSIATPLDVFDYCYAVLHSGTYRTRYRDLLKSDFPIIPWPDGADQFRRLVQLGAKLRQLHLLRDPALGRPITGFPHAGSNQVTRKMSNKSIGWDPQGNGLGRVWINDEQCFDGVPEAAWTFYMGGYQPAQKWLKDRLGRRLSFADLQHYQRMIVSLTNTPQLMVEIDALMFPGDQ
jgi:predicted helicase